MIALASSLRGRELVEKSREQLEREWAERDRIWLLERDWCRCGHRAIRSRTYFKHVLCARCSSWVRRHQPLQTSAP